MVNIVSGSTYSTSSTSQTTSPVENKPAPGAVNPSAYSTTATVSSKSVISYQGTLLSSLFDAADEFIQKEHLIPYPGCRYSNGSYGYMVDQQGSYIDIERYNNYLFDKAATTLLEQAKEKGIELDKKDILAQLKENNAEIAALKFDNQKRLENLAYNHTFRTLTYFDIQSLTDLYIMAKESGEDLSDGMKSNNVQLLASELTSYKFTLTVTMGYERWPGDIPDATVKLAGELRDKMMVNSLGFDKGFINHMLNPNTALGNGYHTQEGDEIHYKFLQFLSNMVDIKQGKTPTEYNGLPPDYVPANKPRDINESNRYSKFARSYMLNGLNPPSFAEFKELSQRSSLYLNSPIRASSASRPSNTDGLSENARAWQESEARFEKYRDRISAYACSFFTRGDRKVVGEAYEIAEGLGEGAMEKIDKLANELAAFRIRQSMQSELVMLAVKQARNQEEDPDAPYQPDLAHLPLLGKIREMAGPGG